MFHYKSDVGDIFFLHHTAKRLGPPFHIALKSEVLVKIPSKGLLACVEAVQLKLSIGRD